MVVFTLWWPLASQQGQIQHLFIMQILDHLFLMSRILKFKIFSFWNIIKVLVSKIKGFTLLEQRFPEGVKMECP